MDKELQNMYLECFDAFGKFKDFEYHITLENNVQLVKHPARKVAPFVQPKLKKDTDSLVEQGITTTVQRTWTWLSNHLEDILPKLKVAWCLKIFFQRKVDWVIENCKGIVGIADDIQVFGTADNHDLHLHEAMERAKKSSYQIKFWQMHCCFKIIWLLWRYIHPTRSNAWP